LGAEIRKAQEPNERLWRGTESLRVSDLQMNAWTWRVYDTVKARLQVVIAKVPHVQICDLLSHHIISYHIIWICYGAPIRSSEAPVRQRVDFKLALLVYKALHDTTAAYLVDDCQLVSHHGRRRHRHVLCRTDQHTVRRPELCSCWTAALEQFAGRDPPARQ